MRRNRVLRILYVWSLNEKTRVRTSSESRPVKILNELIDLEKNVLKKHKIPMEMKTYNCTRDVSATVNDVRKKTLKDTLLC